MSNIKNYGERPKFSKKFAQIASFIFQVKITTSFQKKKRSRFEDVGNKLGLAGGKYQKSGSLRPKIAKTEVESSKK